METGHTSKNTTIGRELNNVGIRWKFVDFGVISTILKLLFKNMSDRARGVITILTSTALSIADTASDIIVAISLFSAGHYQWGCIVAIADYIPSWQILLHNYFSDHWRHAANLKEKWMTVLFLIVSPFSMAIFHLRWLCKFESADESSFDYLHHNSRMTNLLSGSFESPLQIVLLLVLWGQAKLKSPLNEDAIITDSQGRTLYVGILPGVISLSLSALSILKGCLDVSEGKDWHEKFTAIVYGTCNFLFRLPSVALLIMYFNEWATIPLISVFFTVSVLIVRYDERETFSVTTSVLISCMTPFISSDQANVYERTDLNTSQSDNERNSRHRRKLSAKSSIITTLLLVLINLILYLLLKFDKTFKYNEDIILKRETTEKLLSTFLLPMAGLATLSNCLYGLTVSEKHKKVKSGFQLFGFICIITGAFTTSCFGIQTLYTNNDPCPIGKYSSIRELKKCLDLNITFEVALMKLLVSHL